MLKFTPSLKKPSNLSAEDQQILDLFEFGSLWKCTHDRYDESIRLKTKRPIVFAVIEAEFFLFGDDQGLKMLQLVYLTTKSKLGTIWLHDATREGILNKINSDFIKLQ